MEIIIIDGYEQVSQGEAAGGAVGELIRPPCGQRHSTPPAASEMARVVFSGTGAVFGTETIGQNGGISYAGEQPDDIARAQPPDTYPNYPA